MALREMHKLTRLKKNWHLLNKMFKDRQRQDGRRHKCMDLNNMNPAIVKLEYAVRGPLVARALAIENELKAGKSNKPYKKVIRANLGDAHAMGQKPITFVRQVLACVSCPSIISTVNFPEDVKERAKLLLNACAGQSVGSYSASNGIEIIRKHVAEYIQSRDGFPCNWDNVVLGGGASNTIKYLLELFSNHPGKQSGIMIPIPQYPLYSATIAEYGLAGVRYYLNEDTNWGLDMSELERAYEEATKVCLPRAIVIINPGNPTGAVLTRKNIEDVIKFALDKNMYLLADEVYQENIYDENSKFYSFKKVVNEMGAPYKDKLELVSFHSTSKGFFGECGLRGGWMEIVNMDKDVQAQLYKGISANLCSTVLGQCVIDCMVKRPAQGDPSYDSYFEERADVLNKLKERAKLAEESFNSMKGFKCNVVQGAMYAFPKLELPPKAIEAAKKENKNPDVFYAFQLLEETGICVVAGSGFGQREGTYHFRTTILPQTPLLKEMLDKFKVFHDNFTKKYS